MDNHSANQSRRAAFLPLNGESAIYAEQIKLLYQQALPGLLGSLVVAIIISVFLSPHTDRSFLYFWLVGFATITCLRGLLFLFLRRSRPSVAQTTVGEQCIPARCLAVCAGAYWLSWLEAILAGLYSAPFLHRSGCIAAGEISCNAMYLVAYTAFMSPMF